MMAGSGVPGDQIIPEQVKLIAEADGASNQKADEGADTERETLTAVETEKDPKALEHCWA